MNSNGVVLKADKRAPLANGPLSAPDFSDFQTPLSKRQRKQLDSSKKDLNTKIKKLFGIVFGCTVLFGVYHLLPKEDERYKGHFMTKKKFLKIFKNLKMTI